MQWEVNEEFHPTKSGYLNPPHCSNLHESCHCSNLYMLRKAK